jgi:hypothetical protein
MEELLDDNLGNRAPIRNLLIERIENRLLFGFILLIVFQTWMLLDLLYFLQGLGYLIGLVISKGIIIGGVIWWRHITLKYDSVQNKLEFDRPIFLHLLRGCMWVISGFTFLAACRFIGNALENPSLVRWGSLSISLGGLILNFMVFRYLYITNKIEKAIH